MSKSKTPVRFTGQHFTIDKQLIKDLIHYAKINHNDTVIDIGAGKGHLTIELTKLCKKVIAIENDESLAKLLEKRYSDTGNVDVIRGDFRNFVIPNEPFKIASNIPYSITSDILKTLMYKHADFFCGGTLITQLEAAQKLFSKELYNPYSILYHTCFDMRLIYKVSPKSFMPPPTVMSALLQFRKKITPIVNIQMKEKYLSFLFYLLRKPEMPVRTALKTLFRKNQVREIVGKYEINPDKKISRLAPTEWGYCFRELLDKVPEKYHPQ